MRVVPALDPDRIIDIRSRTTRVPAVVPQMATSTPSLIPAKDPDRRKEVRIEEVTT